MKSQMGCRNNTKSKTTKVDLFTNCNYSLRASKNFKSVFLALTVWIHNTKALVKALTKAINYFGFAFGLKKVQFSPL